MVCQPVAPSGAGLLISEVWVGVGAISGSHPYSVLARSGVPGHHPLSPGVDGGLPTELRFHPILVVHLHLHLLDGPAGRPGHPGNRRGAGVDGGVPAGHVDAGLGLDRPLLGPAAGDPVAVESLPGGELDVRQPLGGRHIAVQPGNYQPGGEAVGDGQRLAVHLHGHHGDPSVERHLGGEARGPPVHRAAHNLGGPALHPGLIQHGGQRDPDPFSVAHQASAHTVGHARKGHLLSDQAQIQQFIKADLHLPIHHAVDSKRPIGRVDLGDTRARCRSGRSLRWG